MRCQPIGDAGDIESGTGFNRLEFLPCGPKQIDGALGREAASVGRILVKGGLGIGEHRFLHFAHGDVRTGRFVVGHVQGIVMAPVLADLHSNPAVVVVPVSLEADTRVGDLAIPIGVLGIGQVQLVWIPWPWFCKRRVGSNGGPKGQRGDVRCARIADSTVAIGLELDVDQVVVEEPEVGSPGSHGEPGPAAPFKEVVRVIDEVHKDNLIGVEKGQPKAGIGRVVDVAKGHIGEGDTGEVELDVVEVVRDSVRRNLSS